MKNFYQVKLTPELESTLANADVLKEDMFQRQSQTNGNLIAIIQKNCVIYGLTTLRGCQLLNYYGLHGV